MSKLIKGTLAIAMLATLPAPVLAQANHQRAQAQSHQQVRYAPAPRYRAVAASGAYRWRMGQRLSASQRRYVVSDWSRRGLRAPPRGYRWVRENRNSGDYLLVAATTGLIASILR